MPADPPTESPSARTPGLADRLLVVGVVVLGAVVLLLAIAARRSEVAQRPVPVSAARAR